MMKQMSASWYAFLVAFLLGGCVSTPPGETKAQVLVPQTASPGTVVDMAELVVLNISGATLMPSNKNITDNGALVVSLPRGTYKRIPIAPGAHEFRFAEFPQGNRVANLNVVAAKTYYLVVGYSPGRSWAFPFAGDPMVIKLVSEDEALNLMKEMKSQ